MANLDSLYDSGSYRDTAFIKAYLRSNDKNTEPIPEVDAFASLLDKYSELRGRAETKNKENGSFEVTTKKYLPLDIETVSNCINEKLTKEPPLQLIVTIAQQDYHLIKNVGESLRRVLRRERNKVNVDRAQQLDASCLLWLSKQPGRNTAEKAGSKQQILAIVRYESFDTLENRVFKDFLKLCVSEGIRYRNNFKAGFPKSSRLKDVARLIVLCSSFLQSPEIQHVSNLKSNPKPNYVLQKNPNYYAIWKRYLELRRKHQLIEDLWPTRHIIWKEYFALLFDIWFFRNDRFTNVIKSRYWISEITHENKNGFLTESNCLNVYFCGNRNFIPAYFISDFKEIKMKVFGLNAGLYDYPFSYIPKGEGVMPVYHNIAVIEEGSIEVAGDFICLSLSDGFSNIPSTFNKNLTELMRRTGWIM